MERLAKPLKTNPHFLRTGEGTDKPFTQAVSDAYRILSSLPEDKQEMALAMLKALVEPKS